MIIIIVVVLAVILTNAIWVLSAKKSLPQWLIGFLDHYYMIYFGVILSTIMLIGGMTRCEKIFIYTCRQG